MLLLIVGIRKLASCPGSHYSDPVRINYLGSFSNANKCGPSIQGLVMFRSTTKARINKAEHT